MSDSKNKAVTFDAQGQLHWSESPDAPLKAGEIEVAVAMSTVNPIDVKRRHGYGRKIFKLKGANPNHLALGNDFVGKVSKLGRDVSGLKIGDRVFGVKPPSRQGPHALRVVVHQAQVKVAEPDQSDELLVTLPYNCCTVFRTLESIGLHASTAPGKKILVAGAGGGLGAIALGLLHRWGADITAMDRIANHARCESLGAQRVCTEKDLTTSQGKFDAVLNFAAWELDAALCRTLSAGAMGYATTVHPLLSLTDKKGLLLGAVAALRTRSNCKKNVPKGARYAWALFAVKSGDLARIKDFASTIQQPAIGVRAPMSTAGLAFSHVEQMKTGRALLTNNVSGGVV